MAQSEGGDVVICAGEKSGLQSSKQPILHGVRTVVLKIRLDYLSSRCFSGHFGRVLRVNRDCGVGGDSGMAD